MRLKILQVTYHTDQWYIGPNGEVVPFRCCEECTDAFALLDFIKERAVNGRSTTILDWKYSREEYEIH